MVVMQGRHTGSNEDRKMSIKVLEMTSYPANKGTSFCTLERVLAFEEEHMVLPWRVYRRRRIIALDL